jgi:hypothetical protein
MQKSCTHLLWGVSQIAYREPFFACACRFKYVGSLGVSGKNGGGQSGAKSADITGSVEIVHVAVVYECDQIGCNAGCAKKSY